MRLPGAHTLTDLLHAAGVWRAVPEPPMQHAVPRPWSPPTGEGGTDLTPSQRRLVEEPLRQRTGLVRWSGVPVRQSTPRTCGALCLAVVRVLEDAGVLAWILTGQASALPTDLRDLAGAAPRRGVDAGQSRAPERPAPLRPGPLHPGAVGVAARLAALEERCHADVRRRALLPQPTPAAWPAAIGTPPWGLAAAVTFAGVGYRHTALADRDVEHTRRVLDAAVLATQRGYPVPLFTGGDTRGGLSAAVPRHVVLALPREGQGSRPDAGPDSRPDRLRIFEPGQGRVFAVDPERLLARRRASPALGGWTHLTWAVLPHAS